MTTAPTPQQPNPFADAETVTALLHQLVGAGSVCWEDMSHTGVFQDQQARQVAVDAEARLYEILMKSVTEKDGVWTPQHPKV